MISAVLPKNNAIFIIMNCRKVRFMSFMTMYFCQQYRHLLPLYVIFMAYVVRHVGILSALKVTSESHLFTENSDARAEGG